MLAVATFALRHHLLAEFDLDTIHSLHLSFVQQVEPNGVESSSVFHRRLYLKHGNVESRRDPAPSLT